jgi:O-antigen biosynthesis protein
MSGEDTLKSPAEVVAKPVGDSLPSALPVAEPPRAIQFLADYEGCGHWRMIWPEMVLNGYRLATVHSTNVMCGDRQYYAGATAVRLQRQGTANQLEFVRWLAGLAATAGFRLIYEVDDVMLAEDIPAYNARYKRVLTNPEIRRCLPEIIRLCHEVTVPNPILKAYISDRIGHDRVTVLPSYLPRFWIGNFYDPLRIAALYDAHAARPRVLYAGSGSHFDVANQAGQEDDFAGVRRAMIATRDRFQWVFLGTCPPALRFLVDDGSIEFHAWQRIYDYPAVLQGLGVQAAVAPLQDNIFNRSKSNLKYLEASALGLPIVCQNLGPYTQVPFRFETADGMVSLLTDLLGDRDRYLEHSHQARRVAEANWLEDNANIGGYVELFAHPYGHPGRVTLNRLNGLV